jgi:hypothetical protein
MIQLAKTVFKHKACPNVKDAHLAKNRNDNFAQLLSILVSYSETRTFFLRVSVIFRIVLDNLFDSSVF